MLLRLACVMPDISVGITFANYLKTIRSPFLNKHKYYKHTLYPGRDVDAKQYPDAVLADYRHFIYHVWMVNHAERYFKDKAPQALEYLKKLLKAS